jgi:hypothetical protein
VAEHRARAGARAVALLDALVEDPAEEIEVLLHDASLDPRADARREALRT